jgi:hypothetical protein
MPLISMPYSNKRYKNLQNWKDAQRTRSTYSKRGQIWLSPSFSRGIMLSPNLSISYKLWRAGMHSAPSYHPKTVVFDKQFIPWHTRPPDANSKIQKRAGGFQAQMACGRLWSYSCLTVKGIVWPKTPEAWNSDLEFWILDSEITLFSLMPSDNSRLVVWSQHRGRSKTSKSKAVSQKRHGRKFFKLRGWIPQSQITQNHLFIWHQFIPQCRWCSQSEAIS